MRIYVMYAFLVRPGPAPGAPQLRKISGTSIEGDRDGKSAKGVQQDTTYIASYPGRLQTRKNGPVSTVFACAKNPTIRGVSDFYVYSPDSFSAICTAHSRLPSLGPRTITRGTFIANLSQ